MSTRRFPGRSPARAFSLLEVIVAMGVLAIGATAAFALLVAAAAAGRRAEHEVNAALIAETALNDTTLDPGVRIEDYPRVKDAEPLPNEDPPPALRGAAESRYLVRNEEWPKYPGYRYDVVLTPLAGPVDGDPWHFLVEVEVRWSQKGQRRSAIFQTIRIKTPTHLDPPQPRQ
ncbi:MAG: prepilin-type N-terminal cleavage/methylation domain-containing protein [Planctomycetota bacterium]